MADTKREIERKYEATDATRLPDLSRVAGVGRVVERGVTELDAVYHDTADLRLAAGSLTLRRRTGGADEGWHLKFPVATGIRDELHEPLADTLPRSFAALLRSRLRHSEPAPVVRLLTSRDVQHLTDDDGALLAEVSVDTVCAERLAGEGTGATTTWTEIEVELADDGDPAFLDAVEKRLRKAGVRPSGSSSKLARALAETAPVREEKRRTEEEPHTAGDHVLAYVRKQIDTIVRLDPAVRRDLPDSVHKMRVATRRLRSAFKTYRKILDREVTDPIGAELKWLAGELGVDRDQEVLDKRLGDRTEALPATLVLGPVRGRLQVWSAARRTGSRRRIIDVLDGKRYLALLDTLDALSADPPLRPAASRAPQKALPRAVLKDYEKLARRMDHALEHPPGPERDTAMHEARKAAKRARYAGDAAKPALGKPAKRFAKRVKAVQSLLGDHQDSVVAREALRTLAIQSHAAGETTFTWGLLYGHEEATAEARERELPEVWARASDPVLRADLKH
ncbi:MULTISPECIES: CYTH and CHAD domain-containing protein [unclassified Streptomyces]|uniref:CYTH and CHAD domain-containing protein n=1 Tax=unclassified Streptomyces TaxID=2593676 RepID=UPI00081D423B|nr:MULTISPECIES: CYTH and CHAD domain-containing protein [unclassified Streptomyces]MYR93427.1 CHAD domain-containing protein [Streptomyces sp. SID4937]SCD52376.1 CHAD domain-containing protein [Streptomyces sp. ScaeMP-e83]